MGKSNNLKLDLPTLDDLFSSTNPDDMVKEKVVNLQLKDIVPFPNHPFKVNDLALDEMIESIRNSGVNVPIIVRKKNDENYELISGHRRKRACELLGIEEIPCIIRTLTDDEAVIQMVDSNIQREEILPSERAFAYKMKMEALKHRGERTDLTLCQVGTKLKSAEEIAKNNNESIRQIYRYIKLTELIPELLEMVDNKRISFNPAVEIAYLTEDEQYSLLDVIQYTTATPSHSQAIQLKKLSQEGNFTVEKMEEIMLQEKGNQKDKYEITYDKFTKYIPRQIVTPQEVEDYLLKCVIVCNQMGISVDQIKVDGENAKAKVLQRER